MLSVLNQLCCPFRAKTTFPSFTQGVSASWRIGYIGLSARRLGSQIVFIESHRSFSDNRVWKMKYSIELQF